MRSHHFSASSRVPPHFWWIPIAGVAIAGLLAVEPVSAATGPDPLIVAAEETPATAGGRPIRIAQNGVLDGLFSIFKPKPRPELQRAPDAARKAKTGLTRLPASEGVATFGADPAPIIVRPAPRSSRASGSPRTMCVRLCDGYYWPVNSGTHSSSIARDQDVCEQSCQSETKLFIRPSLGADAGDMRDLSGKPYRKLKTAFLYRKTYVAECKCRPDPWSTSEQLRHEEYRAAATGTLLGAPGATVTPAGELAAAALEEGDPASDSGSDIDLATGDDGGDENERVVAAAPQILAAPAPQTVSAPATATLLPKLPAAKKSKPRSTATLAAAASSATAQPAPKKRREVIGRTIR